jgi:hypothetical protein
MTLAMKDRFAVSVWLSFIVLYAEIKQDIYYRLIKAYNLLQGTGYFLNVE